MFIPDSFFLKINNNRIFAVGFRFYAQALDDISKWKKDGMRTINEWFSEEKRKIYMGL